MLSNEGRVAASNRVASKRIFIAAFWKRVSLAVHEEKNLNRLQNLEGIACSV